MNILTFLLFSLAAMCVYGALRYAMTNVRGRLWPYLTLWGIAFTAIAGGMYTWSA